MKYRIKQLLSNRGNARYVPQVRVLWFFWKNLYRDARFKDGFRLVPYCREFREAYDVIVHHRNGYRCRPNKGDRVVGFGNFKAKWTYIYKIHG